MKKAPLVQLIRILIYCIPILLPPFFLLNNYAYAWWSTGAQKSVHHKITEKAFDLVSSNLKNVFLKSYRSTIVSFTTNDTNDLTAHGGNSTRNGGEINTFYGAFIIEYKKANYNKAAEYLGYCIHLIEDMNVPAHAYNIPHYNALLGTQIPSNVDNFELMADEFVNKSSANLLFNTKISESNRTDDPVDYYSRAKEETKRNVVSGGFSTYWHEGSGADWNGDGSKGYYTNQDTNKDHDNFHRSTITITQQETDLLAKQLNAAVNYVGLFLLTVDSSLMTVSNPTPTNGPNIDDIKNSQGVVVTIDGINTDASIWQYIGLGFPLDNNDMNTNYLENAFKPFLSEFYIWPFKWTNNAVENTDDSLKNLKIFIESIAEIGLKYNVPVNIISHSWGTVLAYKVLNDNKTIPIDRLITLGSPLNSQKESIRGVVYLKIKESISTTGLGNPLTKTGAAWINYWSKTDWISGNIPVASKNIYIENAPEKLKASHSYYFTNDSWIKSIISNLARKKNEVTTTGMATALVLDRSGSMTGEKLAKAKEAAKAFAHTLNPSDQASVSLFSENASTVVEMGTVDSTLGTMDTAISGVTAETSTNIGSGLEQALMQLEKASTEQVKRIALLMSDGMNNRGDWHPAVNTFISKKWRVYTVGFGKDADEAALRQIAVSTGGTYWPADMVNLTNVYQVIGAHAQNKSVLLSTSESLAPNGKLSYRLPVTQGAQNLNVFTNWQGSRLLMALVSPSGETMSGDQLLKTGGRYSEGRTFQMFEVSKPQAGEWKLDVSWAEPPPAPEQVNIAVSEKSDVFANLLGFRSEYRIGEPVIINVQAAEVIGDMDKTPLKNASVKVQIQKPGPQMIQMVQAQSSNWAMYKEVMLDVTRSLALSDDGAHSDYNASDGIFGNSFTETDKNGAYLVTAIVSGEKSNGEKIEKKLQGSFQVGPISQNPVTTSQVLQYMNQAQPHIDNTTPSSKEILDQPKKNIDQMQGNPLDNINEILKKK